MHIMCSVWYSFSMTTKPVQAADVYTHEVGALNDAAIIAPMPPLEPWTILFETAAKYGVDENTLALDVGCANGGASRKLLQHTGCRIEGVELLENLVQMGNIENQQLGIQGRFNIQQGSITDIPFNNNHFDFVFANDVIGMVDDVGLAMRECARVLRPGGHILAYFSSPTERLSAAEYAMFNDWLGGEGEMIDAASFLRVSEPVFHLREKVVIGSQFNQARIQAAGADSEVAQNLLKIAHLLTWPQHYIDQYGEQTYRIVLAEVHWSVYILLGKLEPTMFVLQAR